MWPACPGSWDPLGPASRHLLRSWGQPSPGRPRNPARRAVLVRPCPAPPPPPCRGRGRGTRTHLHPQVCAHPQACAHTQARTHRDSPADNLSGILHHENLQWSCSNPRTHTGPGVSGRLAPGELGAPTPRKPSGHRADLGVSFRGHGARRPVSFHGRGSPEGPPATPVSILGGARAENLQPLFKMVTISRARGRALDQARGPSLCVRDLPPRPFSVLWLHGPGPLLLSLRLLVCERPRGDSMHTAPAGVTEPGLGAGPPGVWALPRLFKQRLHPQHTEGLGWFWE